MLIYGKEIREKMKEEIKQAAQNMHMCMAIVRVGEDPSSEAYIKGIVRFGEESGVKVDIVRIPGDASEEEVIKVIEGLNSNPDVTGIMLQKPLPKHIDDNNIVNAIAFAKDVEGIHNYNLGKLISKEHGVKPCTPAACIAMLKENNIPLEGQKVTIIGRSAILGSPLAMMMIAENATVTICHTRTKDLKAETLNADIVIAAAGKRNLVTEDMVTENTILIDAGINFDENGKMCGDVSAEANAKARIASAVPGGVGVITVAELYTNLKILSER